MLRDQHDTGALAALYELRKVNGHRLAVMADQHPHTVRSTIDCLIVVLAEENSCSVLARDRDIETLLGSGLVRARLLPVESQRSE